MIMRYGSVYLIINKINNMKYVGQTTTTVENRWKAHKKRKSACHRIKYALNKYGIENFEIIELITCFDKISLNYYEKYFIEFYKTLSPFGYNLTSGGSNYEFTPEVKNKMRLKKLGKKSKNHIVPVIAQNIETKEITKFESFKEVQNSIDVSRSSILHSCKYGVIRKGYKFFYANQSGSSKDNKLEHAQRLEGETVKSEYNSSTSSRFPKKYLDNKNLILTLSKKGYSPRKISLELNLDKTLVNYLIYCFGK